jgi:hypothetical protein
VAQNRGVNPKTFFVWNPLRGDPRFQKIVNSLAPKDQSK